RIVLDYCQWRSGMSKLRTNTIENLDSTSSVNISDVEIKQEAYINLGDYGTISTPVNYNNTIVVDGAVYRLKTDTPAPHTINGDWAVDAPKFVSVGDAVLRQELGGGVRIIADVAALQSFPGRFNGDTALVTSYTSAIYGKGGGRFVWDAANTSAANGITVIESAGTATGRWLRDYQG